MSDAEEASAPTDAESTTAAADKPTNVLSGTPAPGQAQAQAQAPEPEPNPNSVPENILEAYKESEKVAKAPKPKPKPDPGPQPAATTNETPSEPRGDSFDKEFQSIIQESQPLVLGGDSDDEIDEDGEGEQATPRVRTDAEEDARAMARARAERNRLKKIASVDEPKSTTAREKTPEEPREKFKIPEAQVSDDPVAPLRDYANQDDWVQPQDRSTSAKLKKLLKIVGIGLGVAMIAAAGWIIFSEIQRAQGNKSTGGVLDMVEKMAADRQNTETDSEKSVPPIPIPEEEAPELPQTRPNLPPSQQLEALVTGANGAALGKDVIRNLQAQVKSIKQDLKAIKNKRNQVEKSLNNIDTILKALNRVDKGKRGKSKRKRSKNTKRKNP